MERESQQPYYDEQYRTNFANLKPRKVSQPKRNINSSFWIVGLRVIGAAVFLLHFVYSLVAAISNASQFPFNLSDARRIAVDHLAILAIVFICFGVAAALATVKQMDARQITAMRRQSSKRAASTTNRKDSSLAPVAPAGWVDHKPPPPRGEAEKKIARRRRILEILDEDERLMQVIDEDVQEY